MMLCSPPRIAQLQNPTTVCCLHMVPQGQKETLFVLQMSDDTVDIMRVQPRQQFNIWATWLKERQRVPIDIIWRSDYMGCNELLVKKMWFYCILMMGWDALPLSVSNVVRPAKYASKLPERSQFDELVDLFGREFVQRYPKALARKYILRCLLASAKLSTAQLELQIAGANAATEKQLSVNTCISEKSDKLAALTAWLVKKKSAPIETLRTRLEKLSETFSLSASDDVMRTSVPVSTTLLVLASFLNVLSAADYYQSVSADASIYDTIHPIGNV
jgi:hypothetical protein